MSGRPVTFFDELERRRRGGWVYSSLCLAVGAGLGLILSSAITPILMLIAGLLLKLGASFGGPANSSTVWLAALRGWTRSELANFQRLLDALGRVHGPGDLAGAATPLVGLAPLALPSLVLAALAWLGLRALALRGGGDDLAARLGARPPKPDNESEHRLATILDTAAVGMGAPTPQLLIVDSLAINAAAVGFSPKTAKIIVTRGLIDVMAPAELEATCARLVAGVCAGDLRVATSVFAAAQTLGFMLTLLDLPVRWGAWRALAATAIAGLSPRTSAEQIAQVGERLDAALEGDTIPDTNAIVARFPNRFIGTMVIGPWLPFVLLSALYKTVLFLWTALLLNPPLMLMWRSRCLWTDARAAKSTLDPAALARALTQMRGLPDGAGQHAWLFLGGGQGADDSKHTISLNFAPSAERRADRLNAIAGLPRPDGEPRRGCLATLAHSPILLLIAAPFIALSRCWAPR